MLNEFEIKIKKEILLKYHSTTQQEYIYNRIAFFANSEMFYIKIHTSIPFLLLINMGNQRLQDSSRRSITVMRLQLSNCMKKKL